MKVNFMSSKDNGDGQFMDSKSGSVEIMTVNETNEIINQLFESLLSSHQIGSKELMKD